MLDEKAYISEATRFARAEGSAPSWVGEIRRSGVERFAELGFPTTRNEDWRFTRVRPLLQHDFRISEPQGKNGMSREQLEGLVFTDSNCHRLVFIDGHYAPSLSEPGELPSGVHISGLRQMLEANPQQVQEHLAQTGVEIRNPFVALNAAYLLDGAFVQVPDGVPVEEPIHLLFLSTKGDGTRMSHPRNLIVAGAGSRATIIESYTGPSDVVYFTNAVTDVVVGDGATVDHYKVQKEGRGAYHVATIAARVGRDARFDTENVSIGGGLVRNDVSTVLDGEGIECNVDGLYLADGHQHVDNHTNIEHARPHCDSHELYKGILGGRARGVFNGKIYVHPEAQKTDAKQSNGCMLLSDSAQVNTNPQLEIFADDVKCTHGAVVGQIDEQAVFYLRSRGIAEVDARHMLVYAFANEVLERIGVDPLRTRLESDLYEWLLATGNDR